MTITEEEAKKKWCPYARVYVTGIDRAQDIGTHNRIVLQKENAAISNPQDARCIASACMAWRWKDKSGGYKNYDDARGRAEYAAHQRGFCGLAGAP